MYTEVHIEKQFSDEFPIQNSLKHGQVLPYTITNVHRNQQKLEFKGTRQLFMIFISVQYSKRATPTIQVIHGNHSECMWWYVCVRVCINFQHLRIHKYTHTLSILHHFIFYCNILGYERKFILQLYNYQEEFILNDTFASCNNIYTI